MSLGLGFYQRTVPSVYNEYVDVDGSEIIQDFRLRIVPATATIRFLPFGDTPVQPYFGGGFGLYAWRYAEFGKFIDFSAVDRFGLFDTFTDRFVAQGNGRRRRRAGRRADSLRRSVRVRPGGSVPRGERSGWHRQTGSSTTRSTSAAWPPR